MKDKLIAIVCVFVLMFAAAIKPKNVSNPGPGSYGDVNKTNGEGKYPISTNKNVKGAIAY